MANPSALGLSAVEKLKGWQNYSTRKPYGDLPTIQRSVGVLARLTNYSADNKKIIKEKSQIVFSIETINYVHIQNTTTAKKAWEKLREAFEDSGFTQKIGLLRTLVSTRVKICKSVKKYVNVIVSTAHQLNGLNMTVPDKLIGVLLLAGLSDEYKPVMELESSGQANCRFRHNYYKLLQEVKDVRSASESAFF